jgi:site-specific recombinase XerD
VTGTEIEIIPPATLEIAGGVAERRPQVHTSATTDAELLAVWLKSHADGSAHTRRAYRRVGERFLRELARLGTSIRRATLDDVQNAIDAMRTTEAGTPASAATLNTYVASIKSLLGFAHKVGFTVFNAAPAIKLRKAPRQLATRLLPEIDVELLLRAARTPRDRLMLEVAYTGALRVSELVGLTWAQVIPRDSGEAQLALIGKGDKARNVLLPADVAARLLAKRNGAAAGALVFGIKARRFHDIVKDAAHCAGINPAASAHWLRHAHASHALDNGAPISLVSQTLGHADIKTTSIYAHAKPGDSSSRYLKRRG